MTILRPKRVRQRRFERGYRNLKLFSARTTSLSSGVMQLEDDFFFRMLNTLYSGAFFKDDGMTFKAVFVGLQDSMKSGHASLQQIFNRTGKLFVTLLREPEHTSTLAA